MFESEEFDLDDEIFLNTQMPIVTVETPIKSYSNCDTSSLEDNNEAFLNIPDSVFESKPLYSHSTELKNKLPEEQNKNKSCSHNNIEQNMGLTEYKTENSKSIYEHQTNEFKLNFDDGFDSDDEAFFNTSYTLDEPINSLKTDNCTTDINLKLNHNESISSVNYENSSISKNAYNSNCNSVLNTTITCIKSKILKYASRKFPGPAGLLSENEDLNSEDPSNLESLDISVNITENNKNEENLCTQEIDSSFSSSPYQQFLSDFNTTDAHILLDKYNVAWIKQKLLPYTASGRFFTDKIPFFVSVIKDIDCLSPDPTVVLADKTGQIRGTIHRAVWNQFSSQLKLGAVLVLSKVGVLCQKIVKSFTLNITNDHLIAIYSLSSEDAQEVIVSRIADLTNEEIVNDAKYWNIYNRETLCESPHSEIRNRIIALDHLKLNNNLLNQNSQISNTNCQKINITPDKSTKSLFKPKTPLAQHLFKNDSFNLMEPPAKRLKNEEYKSKTEEKYTNNEISIIENIFEGINEEELFNDFCC